jgi:hypothetical protein
MIKYFLIFLVLIFSFNTFAESVDISYNQYEIKSGRILYENRKYITHTSLKTDFKNKLETKRWLDYYVSEIIEYYWDDFGDIEFERISIVSKFGGKALDKPIKKYEILYKGRYRYYYNFLKNKFGKDPYYTKQKCLDNWQAFNIIGKISFLYPNAKKIGEQIILGKKTDILKLDEYENIYVCKGIILKQENFSVVKRKGKYVRSDIDSEKTAVNISTDIKLNKYIFNPAWFKE